MARPYLEQAGLLPNSLIDDPDAYVAEIVAAAVEREVVRRDRVFGARQSGRQAGAERIDSLDSLEQRVERTSQWTHQPLPDVDTKGLNLDVAHKQPQEYIRCMYDLVYLAFVGYAGEQIKCIDV